MNCGSLIQFSAGNKPNFCISCGADTATGKVAPQKTVVAKQQIEEEVNLEEDEELVVPDISSLDFDIQGSLKVQKASVGDLMSVSDGNEAPFVPTDVNQKPPRQSKKKFMEEFKREAGSLKKGG